MMISLHQVQLREDSSAMEAGGQVLEVRKRITIGSSGKIKMAVVAASPPGTVRLEDKMKGGKTRGYWSGGLYWPLPICQNPLLLIEDERSPDDELWQKLVAQWCEYGVEHHDGEKDFLGLKKKQ